MKTNLLSLIPPTLLTVLIAATAALRFYDATDFPPKLPPLTLRDWSFWLFTATLLVAVVDFGLRWWIGNVDRVRETRRVEQETRRVEQETRRIEQETRRIERSDRRDIALLTFLAHPTEANRQQLETICQEIQQAGF